HAAGCWKQNACSLVSKASPSVASAIRMWCVTHWFNASSWRMKLRTGVARRTDFRPDQAKTATLKTLRNALRRLPKHRDPAVHRGARPARSEIAYGWSVECD